MADLGEGIDTAREVIVGARIFHKGEWYFSILDIVRILTGSTNPRRYWSELKAHLTHNAGFAQLLGQIEQLKLESSDGKNYLIDTANEEAKILQDWLALQTKAA